MIMLEKRADRGNLHMYRDRQRLWSFLHAICLVEYIAFPASLR